MAKAGRPPIFKQDRQTQIIIMGKHRFLKQDKWYFTNAEFNTQTNRWEPSPKHVDDSLIHDLKVGFELETINKAIRELEEKKNRLLVNTDGE